MKISSIISFLLFVIYYLFFGICCSQTYSEITYDAGTSVEIQSGADVCATNIYINGSYTGGGTICTGALPVILSSFTYAVNNNNAALFWVTQTELNNSGFEVERRTLSGAEGWIKVTFVQGNGTTTAPKDYRFEDKKLKTGKYQYRLKQIDYNGNFEYFQLEGDVVILPPKNFSVSQNYPNPSNPKSKIDYQLPSDGKVTIRLYDIVGREVVMIVNENKTAGYYTAEFDGTNLASGVYFYRIISGEFAVVKKMLMIK